MKFAIDCAKLLAYTALIILLGEAAFAVHRLRPKAELTLEHVNRATIAAGAAAGNVEKASRQWELTSKTQAQESTAVLARTSSLLAQVQKSVSNMDASIGSVSSQLSTTIANQDQSLLETQKALRENLSQMQQATIQLQATLSESQKLIADPAIKVSLDNLAKSSENAATATREASETMAKIHEGVTYEVNELEKPVTKVKAVFNVSLTILRKLFF